MSELEKIVVGHEERVKRMEKLIEGGTASPNDLVLAQEKLLQARLRLMDEQEKRQREAGGNLLEKLNQELAEGAIRAHERRAELDALKTRLDALRQTDLQALADEYEREIALRLPILKDQVQRTQMTVLDLQRQLQARSLPSVTLLGSD
jgi:hypothetical protein